MNDQVGRVGLDRLGGRWRTNDVREVRALHVRLVDLLFVVDTSVPSEVQIWLQRMARQCSYVRVIVNDGIRTKGDDALEGPS